MDFPDPGYDWNSGSTFEEDYNWWDSPLPDIHIPTYLTISSNYDNVVASQQYEFIKANFLTDVASHYDYVIIPWANRHLLKDNITRYISTYDNYLVKQSE